MGGVQDVLARMSSDLVGRLSGPLTLRLFLQPAMAALFAFRDGLADARAGRPAYVWTIFTDREDRRRLLGEGSKAIGKVFVMAVGLDVLYQLIALRWIYPFETLDVAVLLAVIPYAVLRGAVSRIASLWSRRVKD